MKWCLVFFSLLVYICGNAQTDQTGELQALVTNPNYTTILIKTPFNIDGDVNIPSGRIIKFEDKGRIYGHGTINGGIIEANYHTQIFDTGITLNPKGVNVYFAAKWFGAKGDGISDDYIAIQKSINTCIKNNIRTLFIPHGLYKINSPLILSGEVSGTPFCTLELLGQSSFWDSNEGTEIRPTFKDAFAIGIQLGKGCKIRKITFSGLFKPPTFTNQKDFFSTSFEKFTDPTCRDERYSPYAAIAIDPFSHGGEENLPKNSGYPLLNKYYGAKTKDNNVRSGSTGTELEELKIGGFVVGISSSPNGITQNAEISIFNKIQFENCKLCISGGQAQEKANTISNIYCWGGTHTIFATGLYGQTREAGNWNIDHVNIAGGIVRFIYNEQHGYFPSFISHVFAESLGTFGTLNSELATSVSDCMIDFAYNTEAGERNLLTSWGQNIVYRSCNFRFYGEKTQMHMQTDAQFQNCFFSGPVIKSGVANHATYRPIVEHIKSSPFITIAILVALGLIIFYLIKKKPSINIT
ncbi:MAG: hypothetical protein NVS3B19_19770 [Ginsengibacter sp.]